MTLPRPPCAPGARRLRGGGPIPKGGGRGPPTFLSEAAEGEEEKWVERRSRPTVGGTSRRRNALPVA
eukprot:3830432-Pyramimonas_sp.AAC.1